MPLSSGARLGPHEIVGLLGVGGMGEVYLAQDTRLNRRVAIKILPEAYASDPERIARFHREAQAAAALNHPGIAGIYDLAEAPAGQDVVRYLVLELIEGDTLADRLRRGPLPVEEALQIAKQILEALEAAHEKGICHRDLKPANIKLTSDGSVKVLDFGLAKFFQSAPSAANLSHSPTLTLAGTMPGVILGTAGYMSPEQAKGFEADQRSDIFSFGCILFEMLTGRQAFEGETASEILASVLKTEVDLTLLPPRLNPRLVETLRRCLEKNPRKRWHAAADVRVEIESVIGRGLVPDQPPASNLPAVPLWRRSLVPVGAAIAGGLLAGLAAWTLKPETMQPVTKLSILFPDGQQFANSGGRHPFAISPDGANLVYVGNQSRRLHLRPMAALESRVVSGSEMAGGVTLSATFSPDGQELLFYAGADRTLKRLAISGGAAATICHVDDPPYGMSWNEHGIVFGQGAKGILRVSPDGGAPEVIVPAGSDEVTAMPQILPGGRAVLFSAKKATESWDKGQIAVQTLDGRERKVIVAGGADGRYLPTGHLVYALAGTLLAVPFDLDSLATIGRPVPVVEGVRRSRSVIGSNDTGAAHFSVSRTGSLVYYPGPVTDSPDDTDLALFDRKGQVRRLELPPAPYAVPRASPDGKFVAFERSDERETSILIYELAGRTAPRQLTFGGNNRAPIWSPDGQWVAFQTDREGDRAIFRQRIEGGAAERLTTAEAGVGHMPQSWSGDTLLFNAQKGNDFTLWTMSMNDRRTAAFGNIRAREAAFSPDGRWIAYQVREAAANAVYVEPFPRTEDKYRVPGPGAQPFWSPKGDEIVITTAPGQHKAVRVVTSPRVEFGLPVDFPLPVRVELSPGTARRDMDAMPDGQNVIGLANAPGADADPLPAVLQLTVILNWFDELRQRVPQP
jgi:serine/threonine protein kinase/Tol biopolymer transport system component